METCLERGVGPASPRGTAGEPWRASLTEDVAPKEAFEDTESRLRETDDMGEYDRFKASPALAALKSVTSETLDGRRFLRTSSDDAGRLLMTDRGREGVVRPLPLGLYLFPGEPVGVEPREDSPSTSTRGVSVTWRRPW